jgi:hypothetical protein
MNQNPATDDQPDKMDVNETVRVVTSDAVANQNQVSPALTQTTTIDKASAEQQNSIVQSPASSVPSSQTNGVTWTASEFIAHNKSAGWYSLIGLVALILAVIVWFVSRDVFSSVLVFIGVLLLGVYGAHKPRQLTYSLDQLGIAIGNNHHAFSEFRSFSVVSEDAFASIELVPLKRFAMYTTVYFDPADEDRIVKVLSTHLSKEEPRNDLLEQLMRRIRF